MEYMPTFWVQFSSKLKESLSSYLAILLTMVCYFASEIYFADSLTKEIREHNLNSWLETIPYLSEIQSYMVYMVIFGSIHYFFCHNDEENSEIGIAYAVY